MPGKKLVVRVFSKRPTHHRIPLQKKKLEKKNIIINASGRKSQMVNGQTATSRYGSSPMSVSRATSFESQNRGPVASQIVS